MVTARSDDTGRARGRGRTDRSGAARRSVNAFGNVLPTDMQVATVGRVAESPSADGDHERTAEERRAFDSLRELSLRRESAQRFSEFDHARSMLDRWYTRTAAEQSSGKAWMRIVYLRTPEPPPALKDYFPNNVVLSRHRSGNSELLADMQKRLAEAVREHAERERLRIKELEYAESIHPRLVAEELARDLKNQAEMWPPGVTLAPGVSEIRGVEAQVAAQNAAIERTVVALTCILPDGLSWVELLRSDTVGGACDPQAVSDRVESALSVMDFGFDYRPVARAAYTPESRLIVIECELPDVGVIPEAKAFRYVRSRDQITQAVRPATQVKALYTSVISQLTLLFLAATFAADNEGFIDVVVFNGVVDTLDPRSGQPARPCLITARVTRDAYAGINLAHVDPQLCLKHLSAGVSKSPTELAPVKPVLEFSMVDPRFVDSTDALRGMDHRPNLLELSPTEFEGLIQNLFTKMGLEARQTRPSRDGGVDCIAYDTRPIFGGKIVIQAKRYKNTVGVSAVRDLYGTLQNEGASKGILVTTSGYGQASFDFAQNKPIELIDGANLLYLLHTHAGIEARIEPPDDWRDPIPDRPAPRPMTGEKSVERSRQSEL